MLTFLFAALASAPAVSMPPGPLAPQVSQMGEALRRACMSEPGVAIVMRNWQRTHPPEAVKERSERSTAIELELGEAAYAIPVDVDRVERAKRARDRDQAEWFERSTTEEIANLRELSPPDRAIYAQRLAIARRQFR